MNSLRAWKSITVGDAEPDEHLTLYVESEAAPRWIPRDEHRFRNVPAGRTVTCATAATMSRCVEAAPAATAVSLAGAEKGALRVLLGEVQPRDEFEFLAKGTVALRPRTPSFRRSTTGDRVALVLTDARWEDVVVHRHGEAFALQRFSGAKLPPPPGFADLRPATTQRGVVIRPWIGSKKEILLDPAAMLLVFQVDDEENDAQQIPIASTEPGDAGHFDLPNLGSGKYRLKLLSSVTTSDPITTELIAGVPMDILFPSGPRASGRIVRTAGGNVDEPVRIEVSRLGTIQEALERDVLDTVRFTTAGVNGNFSISIPAPGTYRLRATWGSASAEQDFDVAPRTHEVHLGEIALEQGRTLRGSVEDCAGGEVVVIAVPDASKMQMLGFVRLRRAPISPRGHFLVEGLQPGDWSVLMTCDRQRISVAPETFTVGAEGDLVIEFVRLSH